MVNYYRIRDQTGKFAGFRSKPNLADLEQRFSDMCDTLGIEQQHEIYVQPNSPIKPQYPIIAPPPLVALPARVHKLTPAERQNAEQLYMALHKYLLSVLTHNAAPDDTWEFVPFKDGRPGIEIVRMPTSFELTFKLGVMAGSDHPEPLRLVASFSPPPGAEFDGGNLAWFSPKEALKVIPKALLELETLLKQ